MKHFWKLRDPRGLDYRKWNQDKNPGIPELTCDWDVSLPYISHKFFTYVKIYVMKGMPLNVCKRQFQKHFQKCKCEINLKDNRIKILICGESRKLILSDF